MPCGRFDTWRCTAPSCRKMLKVRHDQRLHACPSCGDGLLVRVFGEPTEAMLADHERAEGTR
jgi:hypothetical protein